MNYAYVVLMAGLLLGQENATWSRSMFFRGVDPTTHVKLKEGDATEFARKLKDNGVKYAYLFAGPIQKDGSLPEWTYSATARKSLESMKAVYPELKVLPWVGGLQGETVQLDDKKWRQAALDHLEKYFAAMPVDGVHLDFELLLLGKKGGKERKEKDAAAYTAGLKAFFAEARARFPKRFLSTVVVSTAPETKPWKLKHSMEEVTEFAKSVDQLSFLYYDTGIKDAKLYEQGLDSQLKQFGELRVALAPKAPQLLLAFGTFVNAPALQKYRDMRLENIPDTLALFRKRAEALGKGKRLVDGVAIYCEWLTDEAEWKDVKSGWTGLKD